MEQFLEGAARAACIGIGATMVLDAWILLLKWRKVPSLNFALLGRWIGHLPRGTWAHEAIARAAPVRGELLLGWAAHYAIGIAFAALLVGVCGLDWAREPSWLPALSVGIATVAAPLLIMQPAMGAGFASSKTAKPVLNCVKSVVNHTVFGVGLYVAALTTAGVMA